MPPKGGNAKKESGRAKKAENEAKKKEAVAADKVSRTPTNLLRVRSSFSRRNARKQPIGKWEQRVNQRQTKRKKNDEQISLAKPKKHACSLRRRLAMPQHCPNQNPPSNRIESLPRNPNLLGQVLSQPVVVSRVQRRRTRSPWRSRALLPRGSIMP